MKKFLKFGAALTALVLGLACFAACSNGNDDGGSSNNGGGNTNVETEKPKVTVVAEWISKDNIYTYKFYSDGTYDWLERTEIKQKGEYYGTSSPNERGSLTMSVKQEYDKNSGGLIPTSSWKYEINIYKDYDNGDLYLEDYYRYYDLK